MGNLNGEDFKALICVSILAIVFGFLAGSFAFYISHVELQTKVDTLEKTCYVTGILKD